MSREKRKVYIYTRVSTSMQVDGYSLDAQKSRIKAFCDFNDYVTADEYEDAGKSGKTIEGRENPSLVRNVKISCLWSRYVWQ